MPPREEPTGTEIDLKAEQAKTLATPVLGANILLRSMYFTMDLFYGKEGSLPKAKVLEILARYPYLAWEAKSCHDIARYYASTRYTAKEKTDHLIHYIELGRSSQDNEQCHLLLIEDLMRQRGMRQSWFRATFLPRVMAFVWHHASGVLFHIRPAWSFAVNAKFESHAEHEYMKMVAAHPEWEDEAIDSEYFDIYPRQKTMADLFRRIGLDERHHMEASMEEYEKLTGKRLT